MRVFVTGVTGFIGTYVARALLDAGHEVVALVRPGSERKLGDLAGRVAVAAGDIGDPASLRAGLAGADAAINMVGILKEQPARGVTFEKLHFEGSRHMVDAARDTGVRRFLQMSANGVKPTGPGYQTTKYRAEAYMRASGLDWTIFRPSVVFGDPEGKPSFAGELAGPMRLAPAFPIFGSGDFKLQPVHVEDVASAFARALETPVSIGKTYCLGGPEALRYRDVVKVIASAVGRPHLPLPSVPLALVRMGAAVGEHLPGFPITTDQLRMLVEGNSCPDAEWAHDLGIQPQAFTPGALAFLEKIS